MEEWAGHVKKYATGLGKINTLQSKIVVADAFELKPFLLDVHGVVHDKRYSADKQKQADILAAIHFHMNTYCNKK